MGQGVGLEGKKKKLLFENSAKKNAPQKRENGIFFLTQYCDFIFLIDDIMTA